MFTPRTRLSPQLCLTPPCLGALAALVHPWGSACFLLEWALCGQCLQDGPCPPPRCPASRSSANISTTLLPGSDVYKQSGWLYREGKPHGRGAARPPRRSPPAQHVPVTTGLPPERLSVNALSVSTPTGMAPSPLALAVSLALRSVPARSWRSITARSRCSNTAG